MPDHGSEILTTIAELWGQSTIIQGLMALAATATVCYLSIASRPIPDLLTALVATIVGYYFGNKTAKQQGG